MGMLQNRNPPNLPDAPDVYDASYHNKLNKIITDFFNQINAVQHLSIAKLTININSLPTQANLASLRSGDIYQDTSASNVLKVKP